MIVGGSRSLSVRFCEIIGRHRPSSTPVGLVTRAMRSGQTVTLSTLGQAPDANVDMQTIAIIGSSQTYTYKGRMVTPRGYMAKYAGTKTPAND